MGNKDDGGHDRIIGLPLEIIPEVNPFAICAGEQFTLRVLFHGESLRNTKVVFVNKGRPRKLLSARTDSEGRAKLIVPAGGVWMATTIHMTRAPAGVDADWESLWASLTFEVPKDQRQAAGDVR